MIRKRGKVRDLSISKVKSTDAVFAFSLIFSEIMYYMGSRISDVMFRWVASVRCDLRWTW